MSKKDIMKKILDFLGKQSQEDLSFITTDGALCYPDSLCKKEDKVDMKDHFPFSCDELLNLLRGLLEFNPSFRLTAAEALKSPYFDDIRVKEYEQDSKLEIKASAYSPESHNYELVNSSKMSVEELKKSILAEAKAFSK